MFLFKAINYTDDAPKKMTSEFKGRYTEHACFEDIITTAFSHISHGDVKREKDYWISTTKDINKAIELLNSNRYDYNGIAIIELPETQQTGYIYDKCLREKGYIGKEIINNKAVQIWQPNNDGIVLSLDMSSVFTINYLASYLWLKGNKGALGNIRAPLYANAKAEVLLLGENISFEFISKEDIEKPYELISNRFKEKEISDYYGTIYKNFMELAYKSAFKEKPIKDEFDIFDRSKYQYYSYNEMDDIRKEIIGAFYKNAKYTFDRRIASEFYKLSYANKDTEDFNQYDFNIPYDDRGVSFNHYFLAYVYSQIYITLKLKGKLEEIEPSWKILNDVYGNLAICEPVDEKTFLEYYTKGLGIYPNDKPQNVAEYYYNKLMDEI